jgi:hypothetical protein
MGFKHRIGCQQKVDVSPKEVKGITKKVKPKTDQQKFKLLKQDNKDTDSEMEDSSLLNFESLISDEVIGISDVPIFKINKVEIGADPKPIGSAYILIKMSFIEALELKANARVCVDTGADITICSHVFIIKKFGHKALKTFVKEISNPLRLKSASGHPLKNFGCIELNLYLGKY